MDSAAAERLQKLQMADLGTARREYISTREAKRHVAARMEDTEASRMSNVAGSEAQRLAQANKERLDRWSNMYKEIDDADELEHLDELMNGQSHRAHLSAKVRESGGQTYSKSEKKDDNFLKLSRTTALRTVQSSGRGGGVVGTRARASQSTFTSRTSQGGVAKPGHHISQDSRSKYRPLDPALEPGDSLPKRNRGQGQPQGGKGRGNTKTPEQPPRTKRTPSVDNYALVLSNPEIFLARARNLLETRAPSNTLTQTVKAPDTPKQVNGSATNQSPRFSKAPSTSKSVLGSPSDTKPRAPSSGPSIPAPAPVSNIANDPAPKDVTKESPNVSKPAPIPKGFSSRMKPGVLVSGGSSPAPAFSSTPKGLESSQHASPISTQATTPASTEDPQVKEAASGHSQRSQTQNSTPQKGKQEDILIDVASTPSTDEFLSSSLDKMTLMSPGIKELADLDFLQDARDTPIQKRTIPPPPGLVHTGKANFDQAMAEYTGRGPPGLVHQGDITFEQAMAKYEEKESAATDLEMPSEEPGDPVIDGYRREISVLTNLINTKALSSGTVRAMEASVQELETKIQEVLKESPGNQQPSAGNRGQEIANGPSTPQNAASNAFVPVKKGEAAQETAIKRTQLRSGSQPKASRGLISPSRLKTAVTATPFVPGRKSSFAQYRSPQNSISSESTIFQQRAATTPEHIFGDHLLPGQRARQVSAPRSGISYLSGDPKQHHHHIPQCSSPFLATREELAPSPSMSATTQETPKAPTKPKVLGPAPSLARDAFTPDKTLTPLPQFIFGPVKPQDTATRASSIHATTGTLSSELEKSRYAPENYKPRR